MVYYLYSLTQNVFPKLKGVHCIKIRVLFRIRRLILIQSQPSFFCPKSLIFYGLFRPYHNLKSNFYAVTKAFCGGFFAFF